MGYTLEIICQECGEVQSLEAKSISIDEMLVTFEFNCSCGFNTYYRNLEPAQFEALVHSQTDKEMWAQWSGLSEEHLKRYEYPPDIMKEVDKERRKFRGIELKELLKASRIRYPNKTKDGWWQVYSFATKDVKVEFNRATKAYRIHAPNSIEICKDVYELSTKIQKYA